MEEGTMRRKFRKLATGLSFAVMLCFGATTMHGQSAAEKTLLQKAASQEQSGHIDLAAQTWQQVLLSDPNNEEALAGLGRWAKLTGNDAEAETYIDRLRAVNPNSPEIAKIEALVSNKTQNQLLEQAAELAKNGHNEEALRIYRQTFGTHPPDNWALAYYDTEAGIPAARQDAIDGLRGLTAKYPSDPQYAIDLGRVLTYDPRTRAEGEKILSQYPQDAMAQTALRTALSWDVQNPATMPAVREYLKVHPDAELAKELAETETRQAQATAGIARTPAERAAFRELAANHLSAAQQMFVDLSVKQPTNPRVLAGLGFVRMKQSNFGEAAQYFQQAEQNGLKIPLITQSLATAQFWYAMQQGTEALNANRLDEAVRQYKAALALRPGHVDALTGEAGAYMKMQLPDQAVPVYQELLKKQPRSAAWWRGLFNAEAQAGQGKAAIATEGEFPAALKASVAKDPDYLRNLARAYVAVGQDAQAQKILLQAMNLKYAVGEERIRNEITLQYAALLAQDKNYTQAAAIYQKMLRSDPNNIDAWQGMVSLEHLAGRDADAIAMVERMPPDAYDAALRDGGFLSMLAAIYQGQNHPDVAEGFLERAIRIYQDNGQALPIPLQLQVAALDLVRNHPEGAYNIYRSVLTQHPDNLNAWKGLLAALHATDHDADAMAQLQQIPPEVRKALATDVEYQQTLAAIYAANGDPRGALALLTQVEDFYRAEGKQAPATVDIADAWTLFNVGDDRDLYRQLMTLGDRRDMTDEERRQVQTLWATWAQRRAAQASAAGNPRRAVEILMAAAQAFPGNPAVSKALAVGFVQAGQPKDAMAIYTSLDMTNASASDYQSMVGAAIAVQNMKQAEAWLREALAKFPNDAKVLATAAEFETARGDRARAADYWRASLNAMPAVEPTATLAHKLDQPDLVKQTRPEKPTDLVNLLNPEGEAAGGANGGVPLPSYSNPNPTQASKQPLGPDPYYMGTAPVQINPIGGTLPSGSLGETPNANSAATTGNAGGAKGTIAPLTVNAGPDNGSSAPAIGHPELANPNAAPGNSEPATKPEQPTAKPYVPQASMPPTSTNTQASATTPEQQPEQLGLDTSPALTTLPNAMDEARQQAEAALNAAKKPVDPSMVSTQYAPPSAEIQPQQPDYFERPTSATDDELMKENLPPLRGGYERPSIVRQRDLREQAQINLANIEAGYSAWLGGTGVVNHRTGTAGFDALTALQAPFEMSAPLSAGGRLTLVTNPVFLDAGSATTSPLLPGGVVERLGTAPPNSVLPQQNATGIGGEVQFAMENFAVSAGYSPWGFLVSNVIGRLNFKPGNGPFIFTASRDSVKDSQLSYSGLRDPGSVGPSFPGNIWGGVVATGGEVQFGKSDPSSGFYVSAGGQYLNGVHVQNNDRIDGDAGAYFRVKEVPEQGNLTVGVNFFGMHYAHNENFFTYGQGGYFSPQAYYLANVPFSFQGKYGANVHYSLVAAFGVEAFQQDSVVFFPLDNALEVANANASYSAQSVVSGNYDFKGEVAYHLTDHWVAGGFLSLNNTRDYANQVAGFFVRWTNRQQVESDAGPTGLYPWDGLRPYLAP
jgi:tetratricopeptide (TPR) repeat protein